MLWRRCKLNFDPVLRCWSSPGRTHACVPKVPLSRCSPQASCEKFSSLLVICMCHPYAISMRLHGMTSRMLDTKYPLTHQPLVFTSVGTEKIAYRIVQPDGLNPKHCRTIYSSQTAYVYGIFTTCRPSQTSSRGTTSINPLHSRPSHQARPSSCVSSSLAP